MYKAKNPKTRYQAPAVGKAFALLKLVAEARGGMGLSQAAKTLGFSKGTTHGIIQALLQAGALAQAPGGRAFYLGPTVVDLAFKSWNYLQVGEKVQPGLDALRDKIHETVFLGVLSHDRGFIIAGAEAVKPIKISSPPGTAIPLLAGAVGKVLLAEFSDAKARRHIQKNGLPRFTPRTIIDPDAYLDELALVRRQGYAVDNEEYLPGVKAVAVGLGNHRGLRLALWVVGFAGDMSDEVMAAIAETVKETAAKLKAVLDAGN